MIVRAVLSVKGMLGRRTDNNHPFLPSNANDEGLFVFPEDSHLMHGAEPYWEMFVGLHNILKFFEVDYVHRMSYTGFKGVHRHGVRVGFHFNF